LVSAISVSTDIAPTRLHEMNYKSTFGEPQYGAAVAHAPLERKGFIVRGQRQRINVLPVLLGVLLPVALVASMMWLLSFHMHYEQPWVVNACVVCLALAVLGVLYFAMAERAARRAGGDREPSWFLFMFFSLVAAWMFALIAGDANYIQNTKPYYDQQQLNTYFDVYPNRARGSQIMDAGSIVFANGTNINVRKSMGFKNQQLYCVAPIVLGSDNMDTYDFWAVGKGCCSGSAADFHCQYFNDPNARGGLRVMRDEDRPFYRLAVQQAEATYNIKATHPLFFHWVPDATAAVDEWYANGQRSYLIAVSAFFVWQMFAVACATVAFSQVR